MSASLGPDADASIPAVDSSPSFPAFGIGLLVGAVILGLVWAGAASIGGEDDAGSTAPPTRTSSLLSEPAVAPVVKRTRHDRCVDAVARLKAPLEVAGPAMDQWRVHVGAMNKLVVGEIPLQQAADFWDRTRIGAKRRLASWKQGVREIDAYRGAAKVSRGAPVC